MRIDPDKVAEIIADIAAIEILPRYKNLTQSEIDMKTGPDDLVTAADQLAEERLTPILQDLYPGSVVIGEEGTAARPALLSEMNAQDTYWLVDPVDGTGNFVKGDGHFATIVALVEKGTTTMGWIYPPLVGACAIAVRDAGAFWQGQRLQGKIGTPFPQAHGDCSRILGPLWTSTLEQTLRAVKSVRWGHCSAYAYLDVAQGVLDFVLQYKIYPWDHAAGALLLAESGGRTAFMDTDADYQPQPWPSQPLLSVSDKSLWQAYANSLKDN